MNNLFSRIPFWANITIMANVASIFGLILTISDNKLNPYIFIILIAMSSILLVLLMANESDKQMRTEIEKLMNERFKTLNILDIKDLKVFETEQTDQNEDFENRIKELEECCELVKKKIDQTIKD